jgi:hypothetical protein
MLESPACYLEVVSSKNTILGLPTNIDSFQGSPSTLVAVACRVTM